MARCAPVVSAAPKWRPNASASTEALRRAAHGRSRYSARMSEVLDMAADRRAGRRSGARQHPRRAARRPRADRERARLCGARHAADRERPSRASSRSANLIVPAQQGRHRYFKLAGRARRRDDRKHFGRSPRSRRRACGRSASTTRCARRACATTTSPASSASRWRMRCASTATSSSPTMAAWSRPSGEAFFAKLGVDLSGARPEPPRVLPPLHRLERAARASRRRGRRRAREPADGAALDRAQARHARADHHADRLEQDRAAHSAARCTITRCTRGRRCAWLRVDLAHRCRNPRPQPSVYTALLGRYIGVPLGGNLPVWLTSFGTHFWEI